MTTPNHPRRRPRGRMAPPASAPPMTGLPPTASESRRPPMITMPPGTTEAEMRAVQDAVSGAGRLLDALTVILADLDLTEPQKRTAAKAARLYLHGELGDVDHLAEAQRHITLAAQELAELRKKATP